MSAGCGCGCRGDGATAGGCGCCEGTEPATPRSTANPPGRDALEYRAGTHGSFLATMLARLSSSEYPELNALTARGGDDGAIALLDAWATVGDVLTFYQERIANEAFLRTATERRSILEAARLVGYELRPGVAATVHLAYTLDKDVTGKDTRITIPKGSRAQSVPDPDELPQSFESGEDLLASSAWNNLEPRRWRPVALTAARAADLGTLYFDGIATGLKPGDVVLLVFGQRGEDRIVLKVKRVEPEQFVPDVAAPPIPRTVVTFQQPENATLATVVANVRTLLSTDGGARDLGGVGLAGSQAAQRAAAQVLQPLAEVVDAGPTAARLATALADAVAALEERQALAAAAGHKQVADWLEGTRRDVERELQRLGSAGAAAPSGPVRVLIDGGVRPSSIAPRSRSTGRPRGGDAASPLVGLVAALNRKPPAQPASARALERSPRELFRRGSDVGPRLLSAFSPEASESLYRAWENADVAPAGTLQGAHAMRVKAAPFGAAAPLRSMPDGSGGFVTDEWPLAGSAVLGVRIGFLEKKPERMILSAQVGEHVSAVERQTTSTNRVMLAPGFASVKVAGGRVQVTFGGKLPRATVSIDLRAGEPAVRFGDDARRVWRPHDGEVLRHAHDGRRLTVGLRPSQALGGRLEITVTEEAPLPPQPRNILTLDAQYDQIVPGGWVVVDWGRSDREPVVRRVTAVETVARTAYGMSAKVTRLTLSDSWLEPTDRLLSAVRGATVYAQSERLELAPEPVTDDVSGNAIELGRLYDRLEAGRWIIVEGERTDIPGSTGVRAAEVAMISGVIQFAAPGLPGEKVHTGILLARPLGFSYRRSTVKVWGNVAKATHGETRAEVLGSGDARQAFQELGLRATPLTYLAAANPLGAEGELEVRVDKVRWHKAGSLVELGPDDRSYVTRTGDDDKTTVLFGDGLTGARLPSGGENVSAQYRTGVGPGGNVRAGQISLLQTRPLSVSGVVNPIRASGGAPRDSLDQARRNAPLAVQALDRLVSIQDYEDFARARAGIAKASAQSLSDGRRRVAHLTIAGGGDIPIDPGSDLLRSLRLSLQQWGDPSEPFQVDVRELVLLVIAAGVEIHPDYSWDDVEPRLRAALLDRFGFERRELGQGVALSEVQACMQGVRGVVVADVDALAGVPESVTPAQLALLPGQLQPPPASRVTARPARFVRETRTVEGDETLTDVAAEAGITVADLIRLNPTLVSADPGGLAGTTLVVRLGIRPAQLAILSGAIPDTLILREVKR